MPTQGPTMTYGGGGIRPLWDTARSDAIALRAGKTYAKGTVMGMVPGTGADVNEKQTITVTGTPTGGTFTLRWGTLISAPINFNSTAAQAKTILEATFGTGNIDVTGGVLPGTPLVVEFKGDAAGVAQDLMTAINGLTGGTAPAVAITRTQVGKPAGGFYDAYNDALSDGTQVARRVLQYQCTVDQYGSIYFGDTPGILGIPSQRGAPAYFQGHFRCSDLVGLDANGVADLGKLIHGSSYTDTGAILSVTGSG